MAGILTQIARSTFASMLMAIAGIGQPGIGLAHDVTGTWSGLFALKSPDGTVSHNQVVVRLETHGASLNGSIRRGL
jgi:hypothetical protein